MSDLLKRIASFAGVRTVNAPLALARAGYSYIDNNITCVDCHAVNEPHTSECVHYNMELIAQRKLSFKNWSSPHVTPDELANSGFYYTGESDRVKCAFCHGQLHSWQDGDDPKTEHIKHFPGCSFVRPVAVVSECEEQSDAMLCKICLDRQFTVVFLPCGHLVSCVECSEQVSHCPICRVYIRGTVIAKIS